MSPQPSSRSTAALFFTHLLQRLQSWFITLPPLSKLLIVLVGTFVGLSLLSTVLQLISALVVVAVITVALYGILQLWKTTPTEPPGNH